MQHPRFLAAQDIPLSLPQSALQFHRMCADLISAGMCILGLTTHVRLQTLLCGLPGLVAAHLAPICVPKISQRPILEERQGDGVQRSTLQASVVMDGACLASCHILTLQVQNT